jgi:hypothetical protein
MAKKTGKPLPELVAKYLQIYYDYKNRMLSSGFVEREKAAGKKKGILGHLDRRAKRKMMKEFFKDYYAKGRAALGYHVRPPYQEEYLKHVYSGAKPAQEAQNVTRMPKVKKSKAV